MLRYNENGDGSDALVDLCIKFLPEDVDLEKAKFRCRYEFTRILRNKEGLIYDLIDYKKFKYSKNTWLFISTKKSDNKGGDLKELTYLGDDENGDPIYEDERELRKYYKPDENGKFLHRFQPIYAV